MANTTATARGRLPARLRVGAQYTKADLKRFGDETPPRQPVVAVRTDDMIEKASRAPGRHRQGVFDMEHFNGYPAVLVELRTIGKRALKELIVDGWLACAPPPLAESVPA